VFEAVSKTDFAVVDGANAEVAVFGGDEVPNVKNIYCIERICSNIAGGSVSFSHDWPLSGGGS
jgi:hypothetical protein